MVTVNGESARPHVKPQDGGRWSLKRKVIMFLAVLGVAIALMVVTLASVVPANPLPLPPASRAKIFPTAALSTDAAPCAAIGRKILDKNGSAVDVAIATLLCMGVVNPQSSGLGGGFFMVIYIKKERKSYFLDAREVAPRNSTEDMFGDDPEKARTGGLSVAVPGELAGLAEAHRKFGALPWESLVRPVVGLSREGFSVTKHLATSIAKEKNYIDSHPALRRVLTNPETKRLYLEGETMRRPDLAVTLEQIAREGGAAFYSPQSSNFSRTFLKEIQDTGSIITAEDLRDFKAEWKAPLNVSLGHDVTLVSVPLPGSGALLSFILQMATKGKGGVLPLDSGDRVMAYHRLMEYFKFAYARRQLLEDSQEHGVLKAYQDLLSEAEASRVRTCVDNDKTHNISFYGEDKLAKMDSGTAHMSVISAEGDAVSVTSTVNLRFGSKIVLPSSGVILNDEMDDFSSPNFTNYFGVRELTHCNRVRPGRRPLSSMCPALLVDQKSGEVLLSIGAVGGTKITTMTAQVILRNQFLKEDLLAAIDEPRIHHQLTPNAIEFEDLFSKEILRKLHDDKGHELAPFSGQGMVMAVQRLSSGLLQAVSDYRKGGDVDGI